jgi:spore maturation protein CgeB
LQLGAQQCHPIYNGFDPETHHPVKPKMQFSCDLAFIGNRLPDRERRVDEFFLRAAELAPEMKFLLGGEGWGNKKLPDNVGWLGHVKIEDHNAINSSARMVLNINRECMAEVGYSPPTRVFEAAGAGACLITDEWPGIEAFFSIGDEIVVAASGEQVAHILRNFGRAEAGLIGNRMRERALREHTYTQRAAMVDEVLRSLQVAPDLNLAS